MAKITIGGNGAPGDLPTDSAQQRRARSDGPTTPGAARYDGPTVRPGRGDQPTGPSKTPPPDGGTLRYGEPRAREIPEAAAPADMTLAGWLVIVDGPGIGKVLTIRTGLNNLGRDPGSDLPLPFGDELISAVGHCQVIYDPRNCEFSIKNGSGRNLTYVHDELAIERKILIRGSQILVGRTVLRFVPFCDETFQWPAPK